jgi:hypothetical protein
MAKSRRYNGLVLQRVASCFCKRVEPDATYAMIGYREFAVRDWPRRFAASSPPRDRQIGRFPLVKDIVDAGIYIPRKE